VFTGIVRERGRVAAFEEGRLVVECRTRAGVGDSVAIDGVCLTVVEADDGRLAFDVVPETVARVRPFAAEVNVEPALAAGEPMGGHVVQGHVDGSGQVRDVQQEGSGRRIWIDLPAGVLRYCVEKGSIAVDGVSLTIAAVDDAGIAVALVPHTLSQTTLGSRAAGDPVNVEADILAKYVERLIR
jgi:riboflavin synthase alpha subunit